MDNNDKSHDQNRQNTNMSKLGKNKKTNGIQNTGFRNSYDVTRDEDTTDADHTEQVPSHGHEHEHDDEMGSFTSLDLSSDHLDQEKYNRIPNSSSADNDKPPESQFTISEKQNGDNEELNDGDDNNGHDHDPNKDNNIVSQCIVKLRELISNFITTYGYIIKILWIAIPIILIHIYLIVAYVYNRQHDLPLDCCNGLGFLFILYFLCAWSFFYYYILKRVLGRRIKRVLLQPIQKEWTQIWSYWYTNVGVAFIAFLALITFLAFDTTGQRRRLVSACGVLVIVFIGLLCSKNPERIRWRHVIWALALQFLFGLIILRWDGGNSVLNCVSGKVKTFLDFTFVGTDFLYGYLSSGKPNVDGLNFPPIFVFRALCVIYFFGFVISILYHYGAMQWVIVKLGWLLQVTIGTTAAESMSAAANIFVGQVEAPLLIKPFLNDLTNSEMNAVMTAGFATIAGTVMAAYISLGISASYLLSASVMAAPAALGIAKLIYPEIKESKTTSKEIKLLKTESNSNAIDAAAQGAMQGTILIGCIIANVIAFVSFVAFLNAIVSWLGALVGVTGLTFESILGKCFIPIAFIIGVDPEEVDEVGRLLGLKIVANEFIAYDRLAGLSLSPRTQAITTFALCSFANVGSLGIQLGSLGALLSQERRGDMAKTIGRAFLGGILVGFLNACIAGSLLPAPGYAEWKAMNSTTIKVMMTTTTSTFAPVTELLSM